MLFAFLNIKNDTRSSAKSKEYDLFFINIVGMSFIYILKRTGIKNKGFNSSQDMVSEFSRVFNEEISSGHVRRIRREKSNKFY